MAGATTLCHTLDQVYSSRHALAASFQRRAPTHVDAMLERAPADLKSLKKEDLRSLEGDLDKDEDDSAEAAAAAAAAAEQPAIDADPYHTSVDLEALRRCLHRLHAMHPFVFEALNDTLRSLAAAVQLDLLFVENAEIGTALMHTLVIVYETIGVGATYLVDAALPAICKATTHLPVWAQAQLARIWSRHCRGVLWLFVLALQQLISFQVIAGSTSRGYYVQNCEEVVNATKVMRIVYYANLLAGQVEKATATTAAVASLKGAGAAKDRLGSAADAGEDGDGDNAAGDAAGHTGNSSASTAAAVEEAARAADAAIAAAAASVREDHNYLQMLGEDEEEDFFYDYNPATGLFGEGGAGAVEAPPIIDNELAIELGINVNDCRRPCVAFDDFYNEPLSDAIEMDQDYLNYKNRRLDESKFSFMLYSFILTPATKATALYYDNRIRMFSERRISMFHTDIAGQPPDPFLKLKVRRDQIIDDALVGLEMVACGNPKDLKKQLVVEFVGEQGVDEGGLSKEFFQLVVEQIFNPDYGMFVQQPDTQTVWFNSMSYENEAQFTLIGIVLGLAIYNTIILAVNFPMVVYRKLMGLRGTFDDLADWSPDLYRSLSEVLAYEGGDMEEVFMLTFCISYADVFGGVLTHNLKPGGEKIPVTQENKQVGFFLCFVG